MASRQLTFLDPTKSSLLGVSRSSRLDRARSKLMSRSLATGRTGLDGYATISLGRRGRDLQRHTTRAGTANTTPPSGQRELSRAKHLTFLTHARSPTPNCAQPTSLTPRSHLASPHGITAKAPKLSPLLLTPISKSNGVPVSLNSCVSQRFSRSFSSSHTAMPATKIDGTAIAKKIRENLAAEVLERQSVNPRFQPCLKIIQGMSSCRRRNDGLNLKLFPRY